MSTYLLHRPAKHDYGKMMHTSRQKPGWLLQKYLIPEVTIKHGHVLLPLIILEFLNCFVLQNQASLFFCANALADHFGMKLLDICHEVSAATNSQSEK